jgi:hypothetical protein
MSSGCAPNSRCSAFLSEAGAGEGRKRVTTDLKAELHRIEAALDSDRYRPGPWAAFLLVARRQSRPVRLALAPDVTRVSDKLHQRRHAARFPLWVGLAFEAVGTAAGVGFLEMGLERADAGLVVISSIILTVTIQPLIKIAVGYLVGVRYSHFFFFGIEPRFKMRYGTYLGAERWARVLLHFSGTVGSPLAFLWVALRAQETLPRASAICWGLFFLLVAVQVLAFLLGMAGVRRLGPLGAVRHTSGGAAAHEFRDAV